MCSTCSYQWNISRETQYKDKIWLKATELFEKITQFIFLKEITRSIDQSYLLIHHMEFTRSTCIKWNFIILVRIEWLEKGNVFLI